MSKNLFQACSIFVFILVARSGIVREIYKGLGERSDNLYGLVTSRRYPESPDVRGILTAFDAPENTGKDFGQRMYGWFKAPEKGNYIFYSSCSDSCEVYLSSDDDPSNKRRIISQMEASKHNDFEK